MHVRRTVAALPAVAGVALMTASLVAQAPAPPIQGPWLGVWKLNIEKSQFQTGAPPAGTFRTYVMTAAGPDAFDIVIDSTSPEGVRTMHMELRGGRFDGRNYRETGNPVADFNRFHRTGERSYEFVESKDGVDVITITVEISPDGRTRTSRQHGKGRDGKPTLNIAVWDRQP
jgi:hypothetical protein